MQMLMWRPDDFWQGWPHPAQIQPMQNTSTGISRILLAELFCLFWLIEACCDLTCICAGISLHLPLFTMVFGSHQNIPHGPFGAVVVRGISVSDARRRSCHRLRRGWGSEVVDSDLRKRSSFTTGLHSGVFCQTHCRINIGNPCLTNTWVGPKREKPLLVKT